MDYITPRFIAKLKGSSFKNVGSFGDPLEHFRQMKRFLVTSIAKESFLKELKGMGQPISNRSFRNGLDNFGVLNGNFKG